MMPLLLLTLATWRLTAFFTYDFWTVWLRERAKVYMRDEDGVPKTLAGKFLGCFWCMSLLVAVFLGVCSRVGPIWWLAMSGGAILLNHLTRIYRDHGG